MNPVPEPQIGKQSRKWILGRTEKWHRLGQESVASMLGGSIEWPNQSLLLPKCFHSPAPPPREGGRTHRQRWQWPTTRLCGIHMGTFILRTQPRGVKRRSPGAWAALLLRGYVGYKWGRIRMSPKGRGARVLLNIFMCVCMFVICWALRGMDPRESPPIPQA